MYPIHIPQLKFILHIDVADSVNHDMVITVQMFKVSVDTVDSEIFGNSIKRHISDVKN